MKTDGSFDVVVIGAGVLGSFHAYFACRRGLRTLLIERGESPNDASVRNFGTIVPSAMTPGDWHRRGLETVAIYRALADQLPPFLKDGGTQYLALTPGELAVLEDFARLGPAKGYACRLMGTRESVSLNPAIRADTCLGSLHFPDDLRVEPRTLFAGLIPWMVRSLGCHYLPNTVATGAESDGEDCLVTTAAGDRFRCRNVFVCTGGDFRTLFPRVFAEAGLSLCRLQMMRTRPYPAPLPTTLASGLSLRWYPSFQMTPAWQRLRDEPVDPELERRGIHVLLVQDEDGRLVVGDSHEYSEGDFSPGLDAVTEELILREAGKMIAMESDVVSERWHGIYPLHRDQPVFSTTLNGAVRVVTGIGGKGMTTGPALARESIDEIVAR
jgi:FAD dependent oxidoreductase TIGR03364